MKQNSGKAVIKLLLYLGLLSLIIFFIFQRNNEDSGYSYNYIPVGNGSLSWGMEKEEIIGLLGNPTTLEESEYDYIMTYEMPITCTLGSCSNLVLSLGKGIQAIPDVQTVPYGLTYIVITIDDSTVDAVTERLFTLYGDLTGGATQMELDLKGTNPGLFNKRFYNTDWKLNLLPEEDRNLLFPPDQKTTDLRVSEGSYLLNIGLGGFATGDSYPCTINLDAYALSCLVNARKNP